MYEIYYFKKRASWSSNKNLVNEFPGVIFYQMEKEFKLKHLQIWGLLFLLKLIIFATHCYYMTLLKNFHTPLYSNT